MVSTGVVCRCGKEKTYPTEEEAQQVIIDKPHLELKGWYWCSWAQGYHVTRKTPQPRGRNGVVKLKILERELHEEMTKVKSVRQKIVEYMQDSYRINGTDKFSSQMVVFAIQQNNPTVEKQYIHQQISVLKKDKVIQGLNEAVPDQRGASYFTLTEILEKETEPTVSIDRPKNLSELKAKLEMEAEPKTTPKPDNPFDKVNNKIDLIGQIVTEIHESLKGTHERINSTGELVIDAVQTETKKYTSAQKQLFDDISGGFDRLKIQLTEDHATSVANQQSILDGLKDISVPDGVSNTDDYRAGLKEGIRLAVEMGLKADG